MAAKAKKRETKISTKTRTRTQSVAVASPKAAAAQAKQNTKVVDPWSDYGDHGNALNIEYFLTFQLSRLANAARSNVTRRYLADFGLSVPEWRLLAMTMRFQPARFSELVFNSSMDKGQASRTLQGMVKRGLVAAKASPNGSRRAGDSTAVPVVLVVTPKGRSIYKEVLPVAQEHQAELLEKLTREERRSLFIILSKLFKHVDPHHSGAGKRSAKPAVADDEDEG